MAARIRKQSCVSAVVLAGFCISLLSIEALNSDCCWRQDIKLGKIACVLFKAFDSQEVNELPYYKTSVLILVI